MAAITFEGVAEEHVPFVPHLAYELEDAQIETLTWSYLNDPSKELPPDRFVCVEVGPEEDMASVARTIEARVFGEKFQNTSEDMRRQYGDYEQASSFLIVLDRATNMPAGVLRIIKNSSAGLKALNDAEELKDEVGEPILRKEAFKAATGVTDLEDCWEVGTLAVLPAYRSKKVSGPKVSTMLYRAFFLQAKSGDVTDIVAAIDSRAFKSLQKFGIPFKDVAGTKKFAYIGSPESSIVHAEVADLEPKTMEGYEKLREKAKLTFANALSPSKLIHRKLVAHIAGKLATGNGLDEQIVLKSAA